MEANKKISRFFIYNFNYFYLSLFVLINIISWNFPFFFDCILYSRIAHWFIENDFSSLILPLEMDAGHPPFFPLYIAFGWKILGKSLLISHLLMLPFLLGIGILFIKIVRNYVSEQYQNLILILLLLEPAFLTQTTMVSADIVMVFFFLLAFMGVLKNCSLFVFIGTLGMLLLNVRGILLAGAVFIIHIIYFYFIKRNRIKARLFLPYVISGLIIAGWYYYHFLNTGWFFATPSPNWPGGREFILFQNFLIIICFEF